MLNNNLNKQIIISSYNLTIILYSNVKKSNDMIKACSRKLIFNLHAESIFEQ
jgi:hypothetical protein